MVGHGECLNKDMFDQTLVKKCSDISKNIFFTLKHYQV